jgi:uncharacterized membrane protein YdbT with pleckstrin-like domain
MSYVDSLMSSGETLQLVTRQHWMTLVRSLLINGLLLVVLVLLSGVGTGLSVRYGGALTGVAAIAALVPLALLVRDLATWASRQYIVTTRRVIEVEGVLNRRISDSNLDKVNDSVVHQSALGRLLGFGDIEIITGSDIGLNRLSRINNPLRFQKMMLDNKEDLDALVRLREGPVPSGVDAASAIERLASLRDRGLITVEEFERKKAEMLTRM